MTIAVCDVQLFAPEFQSAPDSLINAHLQQALGSTLGALESGEKDLIVLLKTAHSLALSPFSRDLKLASDDGTTVYSSRLATATRSAATLLRRYA
jgi:hypothetical protein